MFIALVEHLESKFHFFKPKLRSTITNYNQLRQYSASTTYVFAWSEIYVQGIWALLIVAIPVSLALSSRPWVLGWESCQFYLLQAVFFIATSHGKPWEATGTVWSVWNCWGWCWCSFGWKKRIKIMGEAEFTDFEGNGKVGRDVGKMPLSAESNFAAVGPGDIL